MKNISFLTTSLIAHRGVHYLFKENTLSAFQQAIDLNLIIELDIYLTKNNDLIVIHDNNLLRLFKVNKSVKELNINELKKYHIPTLESVLRLVSGKVPIIIELKTNTKRAILALCKLLDNYQGNFAVQSFNPISLYYLKRIRPNYIRGYLIYIINKHFTKIFLNQKVLTHIMKPDFIGINIQSLLIPKIQKLRSSYLLIGYTIQSEKEYIKYSNFADNFICDIKNKRLFP